MRGGFDIGGARAAADYSNGTLRHLPPRDELPILELADGPAEGGKANRPRDFQRALDRNPDARAFFTTLTGSSRYAFLYRLTDAKRRETRARRIEQYVGMLAAGRTLR